MSVKYPTALIAFDPASTLGLPTGAATDATLALILAATNSRLAATADTSHITISPVVALTSQLIISANPNRKGLIIYNNSSNSIYLAFGSAANSSTNMTVIVPTFAQFILPTPVYTGAIYGIRNAGTGTCLCTELT